MGYKKLSCAPSAKTVANIAIAPSRQHQPRKQPRGFNKNSIGRHKQSHVGIPIFAFSRVKTARLGGRSRGNRLIASNYTRVGLILRLVPTDLRAVGRVSHLPWRQYLFDLNLFSHRGSRRPPCLAVVYVYKIYEEKRLGDRVPRRPEGGSAACQWAVGNDNSTEKVSVDRNGCYFPWGGFLNDSCRYRNVILSGKKTELDYINQLSAPSTGISTCSTANWSIVKTSI